MSNEGKVVKVIVAHGSYGCETGCCGHWITIGDRQRFTFAHMHSGDSVEDFARHIIEAEFGKGHTEDLDWDNCLICDYNEDKQPPPTTTPNPTNTP